MNKVKTASLTSQLHTTLNKIFMKGFGVFGCNAINTL